MVRTTTLQYDQVEDRLTEALPEIRPASEKYWAREGRPGDDCGKYIFFADMFALYVEILLLMPSSAGRDRLLHRAFAFVEDMLASDDIEVENLAYVGLLEGNRDWWYVSAMPFLGPRATAELDQYYPEWREGLGGSARPAADDPPHLYDMFGVREVIASELAVEGISLSDVPGRTAEKPDPDSVAPT